MDGEIYYLSSLDSDRFERVRECRVMRRLAFDTGKIALEAKLSPAVTGQDFMVSCDIDAVILSARHEGTSVDPVREFPCFVFVAIPRDRLALSGDEIRSSDLEIIGWGELYRTADDAERHAFG